MRGAKAKDLTNWVFGRITVIEKGPNSPSSSIRPAGFVQWWCSCSCGSEPKLIRAGDLLSGRTTSCTCVKKGLLHERAFIDLTGDTYGRYKVIKFAGSDGSGRTCWWCLCSCGTVKKVSGNNLRVGCIVSCCCAKREHALENVAFLAARPVSSQTRQRMSESGERRWAETVWLELRPHLQITLEEEGSISFEKFLDNLEK